MVRGAVSLTETKELFLLAPDVPVFVGVYITFDAIVLAIVYFQAGADDAGDSSFGDLGIGCNINLLHCFLH